MEQSGALELPDQESARFDEMVEAGPDAIEEATCQGVAMAKTEEPDETLETVASLVPERSGEEEEEEEEEEQTGNEPAPPQVRT